MSGFELPIGITSSPHWSYLAPAAVLSNFKADILRPLGGGETDLAAVGAMLIAHGEVIKGGPARGRWRLENNTRRAVLATLLQDQSSLEKEKALQALKYLPNQDFDPTQKALVLLLSKGRPKNLHGWTLSDLLGLDRALDWLEPLLPGEGVGKTQVLARIERMRLLEPLQRLLTNGFEGREKELEQLRAYVDQLPSQTIFEWLTRNASRLADVFRKRPPLLIHGPGGVGKSTLLAKFINEHADPDRTDTMPFIYLDFGSGSLDPTMPDTLIREAARQIQAQFPEFAREAEALVTGVTANLQTVDYREIAKSLHFIPSSVARDDLVKLLDRISERTKSKILVVFDTFEIVQRRGSTAVFNTLSLGADLLARLSSLRLVVSGRAPLEPEEFTDFTEKEPPWQTLHLEGFDLDAGRAYLKGRLARLGSTEADDEVLNQIVNLSGRNPLSLRLAAELFAKQGLPVLKDAIDQAKFVADYTNEQIQGMLHTRIVESLPDKVQKIADPGLIVRLITPQLISEVLAVPCNLKFNEVDTAEELFDELRREVSLVEFVSENKVRHRQDVRMLMLPLLRDKLEDVASSIDRSAVAYWQKQSGGAARAEEIYHRIWLKEDLKQLEACWTRKPKASDLPDIRLPLEDALDEFNWLAENNALDIDPTYRIWLHEKLGRELPVSLRKQADQASWERDSERRARELLAKGMAEESLRLIRGRQPWLPSSQLWLCEQDALRLLGRDKEAMHRIDEALTASRSGLTLSLTHVHVLTVYRATLLEREDRIEEALTTLDEAEKLARAIKRKGLIFSTGIGRMRLLRKLGRKQEGSELLPNMLAMLNEIPVKEALQARPSLLLEATAEIGIANVDLLKKGAEFLLPGGVLASGYPRLTASMLNEFATLASANGYIEQAEFFAKKALDIAKEIGDRGFYFRTILIVRLSPDMEPKFIFRHSQKDKLFILMQPFVDLIGALFREFLITVSAFFEIIKWNPKAGPEATNTPIPDQFSPLSSNPLIAWEIGQSPRRVSLFIQAAVDYMIHQTLQK